MMLSRYDTGLITLHLPFPNLRNLSIHPHPEAPPSPADLLTSQHGNRPNGESKQLSPHPSQKPAPKPLPLPRAPHKHRISTPVRLPPLQHPPRRTICHHPAQFARHEENPERRPRPRNAQSIGERRRRRGSKRAIERAKQALRPRLNQRSRRDGELADPQPARPARHVAEKWETYEGLDARRGNDDAVISPRAFPPRFDDVNGRRGRGILTLQLRRADDGLGDGFAPEEVADEMIFADVVGEEVDSRVRSLGLRAIQGRG